MAAGSGIKIEQALSSPQPAQQESCLTSLVKVSAVSFNPSTIVRYSHADVQRIRFIKRAQTLGFNLDNIADLLELDGSQICDVTHELALKKLHLVEEKIAALQSIRDALQGMVRQCESKHERGVCPIIQSLATDELKISRKEAASSAVP